MMFSFYICIDQISNIDPLSLELIFENVTKVGKRSYYILSTLLLR